MSYANPGDGIFFGILAVALGIALGQVAYVGQVSGYFLIKLRGPVA